VVDTNNSCGGVFAGIMTLKIGLKGCPSDTETFHGSVGTDAPTILVEAPHLTLMGAAPCQGVITTADGDKFSTYRVKEVTCAEALGDVGDA